ncbi:hypothetical protein HMPREF1871_01267 [Gemelliphila asaccharolytica]|uniref:Uncharacterized protein n=1 Tax=Gemelliphila asaccharolytica TaxID=502393 RepID=A0ABR5TKA5_9BACL|nr:hypothetical protein HMPREF1871_01267 [Gemella asaccharolytica]
MLPPLSTNRNYTVKKKIMQHNFFHYYTLIGIKVLLFLLLIELRYILVR